MGSKEFLSDEDKYFSAFRPKGRNFLGSKPCRSMGPICDTVAYRDSFPDTIMTHVKSVPLLPCWTWTVFIFFMFWSGALVCLILQKSLVVEPDRNVSKILVFRRVSALCFRQ
jgi:hypothetical protein